MGPAEAPTEEEEPAVGPAEASAEAPTMGPMQAGNHGLGTVLVPTEAPMEDEGPAGPAETPTEEEEGPVVDPVEVPPEEEGPVVGSTEAQTEAQMVGRVEAAPTKGLLLHGSPQASGRLRRTR